MASDVGVKLGVEGEKAFQNSLKAVNAQIKALGAEMAAVTASFVQNADSQQALAAKNTVLGKSIEITKSKIGVLNKEIENQSEKLGALEEALANASAEFGEQSTEALKAQNAYNEQSKKVSDLTAQLYKAEVQLSGLNNSLKENNRVTEGSAEAMEAFGKEAHSSADGVSLLANALAATGLAKGAKEIADALYSCVDSFAAFDAQMSAVQAISGATGEDMAALSEKAKYMGATTSFTAKQAAEAFEYMAMAGWKTEDMLSGIEGILHLAAASGESLASTSDIVTDALTAFGLSASDSARFADVLAVASSNANTNVSMMGETFKYVAPVAGALGYSIEDTAVAVGLMANAGIKSTQAGSALRSVLTNLAKPSKEVAAYMEKLGVSLTDNKGKMRSLSSLLLMLRERFSGLAEAERAEYAAGLAGKEAMSGLLAIVEASEQDFRKLTEAISDSTNAAYEMSQIRLDNYAGQITLLDSAVDGLKLTIGSQLSPVLEKLAKGATTVVGGLTELMETCPALTAILAGLISSVGVLTSALAGLSILKAVTTAMTAFNLSLSANPIFAVGVAIVGVVAALGTLAAYCNDAADSANGLNKELQEIEDSYKASTTETLATAAAAEKLIDKLSSLESQESMTEAETTLYARTVAQLRELMPELNLELDEQTGLLIDGADALRMNTNAWKENALAQALQTKYNAVLSGQAEALVAAAEQQLAYNDALGAYTNIERELAAAKEELAKVGSSDALSFDEYSERLALQTGVVESLSAQYAAASISLDRHKDALDQAQQTVGAFDQELDRLIETEAVLSGANEDGAASADVMAAHVEGLVSSLESLGEAYDQSYHAALESIDEQLGLFNELDGSAKTSIDSLIATLQGQVAYMEDYAANIKRAMELGVDEGLIQKLSDGSEESAQILAAIVEGGEDDIAALNEQLAKVEEGKKDFSATIAEMENDFSGKMEELVLDLTGSMQEMDQYDEMLKAGENNIRGLIEGTIREQRALVDTYTKMGSDTVNAYKRAVGQHSPSKEFRQAGRYDIQGLIGGAESEGRNLENAYIDLAKTATLGVAEGIADSNDEAVKAARKLAEDVYASSKKWAERQAKYQKTSLREQLADWRGIQDQFVQESKQYAAAEEKILDLRAQMQAEYTQQVEDAQKKIMDQEEAYQKALAQRQKEIAGAYGLFDEVAEREAVSGRDLLGNLRDQVAVMKSFYNGVEELEDRGLAGAVIDEIRAMGPAAEQALRGLLDLTDRELTEYANVYMEKQQLANRAALTELEGLRQETVNQIAGTVQELKSYYDQNAPDLGLSFTDGLVNGMLSGLTAVRQAAMQVADTAMRAAGGVMTFETPPPAYADLADTMTRSGTRGGGGRTAEALERAADAISRSCAGDCGCASPQEIAAAVAAALDGMDLVLDGRKVGQVITTRQQNDNRAFDR